MGIRACGRAAFSAASIVTLSLLVVFAAALGRLHAQGASETFVDPRSEVRLALPAELIASARPRDNGTVWSTRDKTLVVETLSYDSRTLRSVYESLKALRGRKLSRDEFAGDRFLIEGSDADGSQIAVEMRQEGTKVRGYSIVYEKRAAERAVAVIAQVRRQFDPFPGAPDPGVGSSAARPAERPPASAEAAITIQPNLGDIPDDADVKFAPNGKYIAIREESHVKLWDIAAGRPLRILEHTAYFEQFTFIDDGARILSLHKDGQARIWDPLTGQEVASARIEGIEPETHLPAMTHDPGRSSVLIVAGSGQPVADFDYRKMRTRAVFKIPEPEKGTLAPQLAGAVLSKDGKSVFVGGEGFVYRFDAAGGAVRETLKLRDGLAIVRSGLITDGVIVAKTAETDCDAGIVLVTIAAGTPRYNEISPKPGCKHKPDGEIDEATSYDSISLTYLVAKRLLYVGRRGTSVTKIVDLQRLAPDAGRVPVSEMPGTVVALDELATRVALHEAQQIRIESLADGNRIGLLMGHGQADAFPIASADGREVMLHHTQDGIEHFTVWPIDGIAPRFHSVKLPRGYEIRHAVPDANAVLGTDNKGSFVVVSILTGKETSRFTVPGLGEVDLARLSPDAHYVSTSGTFMDAARGKIVLQFGERKLAKKQSFVDTEFVSASAFSPNTDLVAVGWSGGSAEVWNIKTGKLVRKLEAAEDQTSSLTFSADNKTLLGGSRDAGIFVWSIETGKLLRTLDRQSVAGHVSTGSVAISPGATLVAAGPRQRAKSSGDVGRERRVQVWDLSSGNAGMLLSGHEANVNVLIFTANGRWLVSGSNDGTIRYWEPRTGRLGATFAAGSNESWAIVTSKGLFAASANAADLLSVVRGFEATSIEQMWQSLYAPDLVRQFLIGESLEEFNEAVAFTDLAKALDSGPAPGIAILPALAKETSSDLVDVTARVADAGKGVGRIEWRVNGVTAAVVTAAAGGAGPEIVVTKQVALDAGDNILEVVAYNAGNLLASVPAKANIRLIAGTAPVKPKLYVLAIGINAYVDKGWVAPGETARVSFPPLSLAVNDAETLAAAFAKAAAGEYADIKVTKALDGAATLAGLDAIVAGLAAEVQPRDTFILFAAAHGTSLNGHFYLIPQDYDGGTDPAALRQRAVGQDRIQDWIANRIKAKRAIVLLDTCESGALVGGLTRSRTNAATSEAAIGRLHEATGRPVLTAAAEGKPAFEGFEGHGVFTWALLDSLRNGDRNANGMIELSEIVAHVQDHVPEIAAKLDGRGRAAAAVESLGNRQSARFGSHGENFSVVRRLN